MKRVFEKSRRLWRNRSPRDRKFIVQPAGLEREEARMNLFASSLNFPITDLICRRVARVLQSGLRNG